MSVYHDTKLKLRSTWFDLLGAHDGMGTAQHHASIIAALRTCDTSVRLAKCEEFFKRRRAVCDIIVLGDYWIELLLAVHGSVVESIHTSRVSLVPPLSGYLFLGYNGLGVLFVDAAPVSNSRTESN